MRQLEEDLIGEFLILEVRRLERLEEVEVEVPWRLGRRTLVGCAEEQVASAGDLVFPPLDLVFPNLVATDVRCMVGQFQHTGQGVESSIGPVASRRACRPCPGSWRRGRWSFAGPGNTGRCPVLCVMNCPLIVFMISLRQASTVVRRKSLVFSGIGANRHRPF